jgi:hypothetical protein
MQRVETSQSQLLDSTLILLQMLMLMHKTFILFQLGLLHHNESVW